MARTYVPPKNTTLNKKRFLSIQLQQSKANFISHSKTIFNIVANNNHNNGTKFIKSRRHHSRTLFNAT